ncbi:MAG TPA: hypothetical protein VJZ00_23670 [Thermoanaerobaculia bacterium]|nr:hypothetical protein [Thermoanaerobaculia bacterium]
MRRHLLISLAFVMLASPLLAQNAVEAEAEKQQNRQALRDPSLQSTILGTEEAFKIEAEKGEQKATVKLSFGGTTKGSAHILLSAPVNKNADQQSLANLHGLSGSSKLELGYSRILSTIKATFNDELSDALCKKNGLDPGCDLVKLQDKERDPQAKAVTFSGMTTALGIKGEFTRTKFDYLTKGTLASNSDTEPQYAASIAYGVLPHHKLPIGVLYFAGLGMRYESGYEAQKKQQICTPLKDTPTATTCSEVSLGAPDRALKRIAEFRTRWYPSDDVVYDIVIARDFQKDVTGIEIPVSFIRGKDNLFTGGISIGWRSDTDEVTASVFIGALKNVL